MTQRKFPEQGKCRTCRCPCTDGHATDLFQDNFKGQTYGEILLNRLAVKLPDITSASCTICMRCTKFLESVDAFVRQCQQTNELLEYVTLPVGTSALAQETKVELDQSAVVEKNTSAETACYLEMNCDEDSMDSMDIKKELVVSLEMLQPADTMHSADEGDDDDQKEDLVLFTSKILVPKEPSKQRGRGPTWRDEQIKQLLQVAKKYRLSNGKIDNTMIHIALRNHADLSRYSREAIKAKLHSLKRLVKEPGMPKIKSRIYESDALVLFGDDVEL